MTDHLIDVKQAERALAFVMLQIQVQYEIEEKCNAEITMLHEKKKRIDHEIRKLSIRKSALKDLLASACLQSKSRGPSEAKEPT